MGRAHTTFGAVPSRARWSVSRPSRRHQSRSVVGADTAGGEPIKIIPCRPLLAQSRAQSLSRASVQRKHRSRHHVDDPDAPACRRQRKVPNAIQFPSTVFVPHRHSHTHTHTHTITKNQGVAHFTRVLVSHKSSCRNQMPPTADDQMTIEKTPSYFVKREVPARIFLMSSTVKLIVVVRDPTTRAISGSFQSRIIPTICKTLTATL